LPLEFNVVVAEGVCEACPPPPVITAVLVNAAAFVVQVVHPIERLVGENGPPVIGDADVSTMSCQFTGERPDIPAVGVPVYPVPGLSTTTLAGTKFGYDPVIVKWHFPPVPVPVIAQGGAAA
jgi:hypothetical protein